MHQFHKLQEFHPGPARKLSANLYDIYHSWVHSEQTPDDRQRNCPKYVVSRRSKFRKIGGSGWFCYKETNNKILRSWDNNGGEVSVTRAMS
jgi:hypothetical protein